jgi:hypothetical protein
MIEGIDQLLECMLVISDIAINRQVPAARGPADEEDDEEEDDEEEEDEIREPRRRPIEPLHTVSELHLTE